MVTEEISAHTLFQRRPSASVYPPLGLMDISLKKESWFERIKDDLVVVCAHKCPYVLCLCGCDGSLFLALRVFVCVLCFFWPGTALVLQGMPLKMGRATFNPHTASSESGHIKSLPPFNPNSAMHSRD